MLSPMRAPAVALVALSLLGSGALPAAAQIPADRVNRGLVEIVTGSVEGSALRMAADLANVLDDGNTRRVLPVVGKGSLQNVIDVRALRGVDMAIVQTDVLAYAKDNRVPANIENQISYIAKLSNEEFHLLARDPVNSVADLAGKKVNIDVPGSGTSVTATQLFKALNVKVETTSFDQAQALEKLRSGEIAAAAFVTGKPSAMYATLKAQDGLRFVPIPLQNELLNTYLPSRLTGDDYPNLVQAPVDTVAVGTVLVVANLQSGTERYRNAANFVDAFFTQFPKLLDPGHHPKWQEVNISADLPGWRRFGPADAWLKKNAAPAPAIAENELRDIFSRFLDERGKAAGRAMNQQQKDELFDQFQRWQNTQRR
jgi:TRAP transporter TAXI family solute receptor